LQFFKQSFYRSLTRQFIYEIQPVVPHSARLSWVLSVLQIIDAMILKSIPILGLIYNHHRAVAFKSLSSVRIPSSHLHPNINQRYHHPNINHQRYLSIMSSTANNIDNEQTVSKTSTNGKVIVVGSINQDLTTYASSLPSAGQTILGTDFVTTGGGKGANQAVAASKINIVDSQNNGGVRMIGRVGNDAMGNNLLSSLQTNGVKMNIDEMKVDGQHTGVASINVDTNSGQNTIVVSPGANLALSSDDVQSSLANMCEKDVVLVQLEIKPEAALQALKSASSKGALTILNPAPAPKDWELTPEWYSYIDVLIPNETELASLCGLSNEEESVTGEGEEAMARQLLDKGIRHAVIVTLGERGAMIVRRRCKDDSSTDSLQTQTIMISEPSDLPCKSQPVVDTVGAGDAFCGALSAYLSRGVELEKAASMACGVASMSVRKRGAQESYVSASDLPDCLKLESLKPNNEEGDVKKDTRKAITFVTGNKNKLMEVQRLLATSSSSSSIPFDITNHKLDLPELQGTPEEIARVKCQTAAKELQTAVLTEDTCLCFRALNDLPGPYIKWFLDGLGHEGLNKLLEGFDDTRAYAQTIIAFCPGPDSDVVLFQGQTEGSVVPSRGPKDFGWDAVFEPTDEEQGSTSEEDRKTYAEMTKDEKNAISHRGRAFEKFRNYLLSEADGILKDMR